MVLRFIDVAVCTSILFPLLLDSITLVWFIMIPVDGHVRIFRFLDMMKNSTMNICVQVFV